MVGRFFRTSATLIAALGLGLLFQSISHGQDPPDPADTNAGGIQIDADGVLSARTFIGDAWQLNRQRLQAAQATQNNNLQQPSELRKISLTRLERQVGELIEAGEPIPADMKYLAGMTRITHVFFYPETKDIVIAGPAEGYFVNAGNRVVGMKSGQATLHLQDLIVALRAFAPNGKKTRMISCSIDPTQEGLLRMREAYASVQGRFRLGDEAAVVDLFTDAIGMQKITVNGISTKTRFASVMVEADYRMKLIGIGLLQPPVRITSFIEKATPRSVARNSLQRWFFQPNYDCVHLSEDKFAMELTGSGVKLVGEDENVARDGQRKGTGGMNPASRAFCASFTRMYDRLAQESSIWGELRNLIDMTVCAAYLQKMDIYGHAGWEMTLFGDEDKYPVETLAAPTQVAPVANAVWKGRHFMTPIAGGVTMQPRVALNSDRAKTDESGKIDEIKASVELDNVAANQWWWD